MGVPLDNCAGDGYDDAIATAGRMDRGNFSAEPESMSLREAFKVAAAVCYPDAGLDRPLAPECSVFHPATEHLVSSCGRSFFAVIRITRAYCIELERVVTADEARREFLSLDAPPKRFSFSCTEDRCRAADPVVRVTGAAYTTAAAESEKYVSAHFRRLDSHLSGCFWNSPENDDSKPLPGETAQSWSQRRARRKLTDFVDVFDPRLDNETEVSATYFCPIGRATLATRGRVLFGGASLVKRYGQGFKLKFYDKVEGLPVFLYVSPDAMANYRYRKYLVHIIEQADAIRYFKIFAIGELRMARRHESIECVVESLRHLAVILGPMIAPPSINEGNPSASSNAATK